MIIDDGPECRTHSRIVINFDNINLPNIIRLAKANNNTFTSPLKEHSHLNSFELVFFFSGEQVYSFNSESVKVMAGEFFISMPNELHGSMQENEEKSNFFYLIFYAMPDEKHFLELTSESNDYIIETLFNINKRVYRFDDEVKPLLNSIINEYFNNSPMKYDYIKSLFVQLFYSITNSIRNDTKKIHISNNSLDTVINLMEENPQKFFSTEELSSMVYMSNSYFKSSFKKYTGFTPYDYMIRNKIAFAEDMLRYTFSSITDIAFELGFTSSQHFSSLFKKYTLQTPSEFRKQHLIQ